MYSDGKRLPAEVAAGARAAGLDFMVTTDRNTNSSHAAWGLLAGDHHPQWPLPRPRTAARDWIDWRYRARDGVDFPQAAQLIHRSGGIVVPAHPYCAFVACRWKFGYDQDDAVEVWNGPWTTDDESAVDTWDSMLAESVRGNRPWLPAMGNSDAHSEPQVIGLPHNVVLSDGLSKDALLDGTRSGRNWIAESSAVNLTFSATSAGRTAGISQRLAVADLDPVDVTLEVSGVPDGVVRIISDEGQVMQASLPASGAGTVTYRTTPSLAPYVRPRSVTCVRTAPRQRQRHGPRPATRPHGPPSPTRSCWAVATR